jgi:hypothetical protein
MSVEVVATEFERRLARTREKMKEQGIDVLFVYSDVPAAAPDWQPMELD